MSGDLHVQLRSERPVRLQAEFDCAAGELVALVGASGSGKTTILRSIAGLHHSADLAGRVQLGNAHWMDSGQGIFLPAQERRVGLVFQHYALFPHLNAMNNIAICVGSMRASSQNDAQKNAADWLQRLGMAQLGARLPHELSGGQQQRVALARALVRIERGNGILLLDEPFSAVDAPMRQVLYRELAQLRQSLNVPIVLVTHDLHEARRLADRIVIIDAGQTLQSGAPAQVMRSPRNARVAELVGIHNHFRAQFHSAGDNEDGGQAWLHWGELRLKVRDKGKIESGTQVTWVLAGEAVQLRLAKDAADASANHLVCQLTEMLPLGEISLCRLAVRGTPDTIQLNLPTAQLATMAISTGKDITLRIPIDAAHIMPLRH